MARLVADPGGRHRRRIVLQVRPVSTRGLWLDLNPLREEDPKMIETIPTIDVVEAPMADSHPVSDKPSVLRLTEWLLKDRGHVEDLLRHDSQQIDLIPRFLAIALASFTVFAWAMVFLLFASPPASIPSVLAANWSLAARP